MLCSLTAGRGVFRFRVWPRQIIQNRKMTPSNRNGFRPFWRKHTKRFSSQRGRYATFDFFFVVSLYKLLSKQLPVVLDRSCDVTAMINALCHGVSMKNIYSNTVTVKLKPCRLYNNTLYFKMSATSCPALNIGCQSGNWFQQWLRIINMHIICWLNGLASILMQHVQPHVLFN